MCHFDQKVQTYIYTEPKYIPVLYPLVITINTHSRFVSRINKTQKVDNQSSTIANHQIHSQEQQNTCMQRMCTWLMTVSDIMPCNRLRQIKYSWYLTNNTLCFTSLLSKTLATTYKDLFVHINTQGIHIYVQHQCSTIHTTNALYTTIWTTLSQWRQVKKEPAKFFHTNLLNLNNL